MSLSQFARERFLNSYINGEKAYPIVRSICERKLVIILKRHISPEPTVKYHLNGCCIPAVRRLFVSIDGTFQPCERIPMAPSIGNVFSGVEIDTIKKIYIDEYADKSLPTCSGCWAIRICPICYTSVFANGMIDINYKNLSCIMSRISLEEDLKFYCNLLEINPKGLSYLSERSIK